MGQHDNKSMATVDPTLELRESTDSYSGNDAKQALQKIRQDLRDSKRRGDQLRSAWNLVQMAMVMRGQRQYQLALQVLEDAKSSFSLLRDNLGLATIFYELSVANREKERHALALEYGNLAVKMFQELGRTHALAWAYDNMSIVHDNLFNRHESLNFAKKARAIFLEFNTQSGLAWNACNLGKIYRDMALYPQAEKYYQEAIRIFKEAENKQGLAWAHLNLGMAYRYQFVFDLAEDNLKKSNTLYRELQLKDRLGWGLINHAAIQRCLGHVEDALLINKRAIQLFGPIRNQNGTAWSLFQVGQILRDRGNYIKSWQTLREALNLFTDIANRQGIGWTENEWGKTYLEMGDLPHARESFVKAKVISEQLDEGSLKVEVEKNIARVYLEEGLLQKGIASLDQVLQQADKINSRETEAEGYLEKVRYFLVIGDPKQARYWINAADSMIEKYNLQLLRPILSIFIGEMLAVEGKYDDADMMYEDAMRQAEKSQERRVIARARLGIIQKRVRRKEPAKVEKEFAALEKDIRILSSRKLKAKFLLLRGWANWRLENQYDSRSFSQCAHILEAAGLSVFHRMAQSYILQIARETRQEKEQDQIQNAIKKLLETGPVDLHLVRPLQDVHAEYPLSFMS